VALVIVLAFVVLLTGLVVAYFTRSMADRQLSNSSFNQAAADQLAHSALAVITGNLKQELASSGSASQNEGTTIFVNPEVLPVRNGETMVGGTSFQPSELLRVSSTSVISSSGVEIQASNDLSTGTSANGRSVSTARWNQHYLIPRLNPASTAIDCTPWTNFTPPSWVYVSGTGPYGTSAANPPLTAPNSAVIGRYAYAIYDEGGLLDVNTAGYPCVLVSSTAAPYMPNGTTPQSQQARYVDKGALAFADLTALGLSTTCVNGLVGWRNYATLGSANLAGSFPSITLPGGADAADRYYTAVTSNTSGFLTVSGSTSSSGLTDQAFLSRQELINFVLQGMASSSGTTTMAGLQNALQYLGTFSRAVTAPSWSPEADANQMQNAAPLPAPTGLNAGTSGSGGTIYAYKTNSETNGFANRDLANVRFPSFGTITHYYDDGTSTTYTVNAGDPYLQRRFSLARINWLTHTGPAVGLTQAVKDCFGLQWGHDASPDSNPCWMYIHGTKPNQTTAGTSGGTTTANQILTLDAVAKAGREPDFFELLKAAILNGSLGQNPGKDYTNYNGFGNWYFEGPIKGAGGMDFDKIFSLPDEQIIQIGVNIIDQYHSDSYPTAIFFQGNNIDNPSKVPENGPLNVFYGIKNLPYLNRIHDIFLDIAGPGGDNGYSAWLQPELWNPFQSPAVSGTAPRPSSFCAEAYGFVKLSFSGGCFLDPTVTVPTWDYDSAEHSESFLYFKDPPTSGGSYISAFADPELLTAASQDTSTGYTTPPINIGLDKSSIGSQTPYSVSYAPGLQYGYNQFMAFHAAYTKFGIVAFSGTNPVKPPNNSQIWMWDDNNYAYQSGTTMLTGSFNNYVASLEPILPPTATRGVTFCLKYWDGTQYLPYTYMSRVLDGGGCPFYPDNKADAYDPVWGELPNPSNGNTAPVAYPMSNAPYMHVDPLTDRFAGTTIDGSHYHWPCVQTTWQQAGPPPAGELGGGESGGVGEFNTPLPCPGVFYYDFLSYQN
jgi:Tfp pilus assembly protein PilX